MWLKIHKFQQIIESVDDLLAELNMALDSDMVAAAAYSDDDIDDDDESLKRSFKRNVKGSRGSSGDLCTFFYTFYLKMYLIKSSDEPLETQKSVNDITTSKDKKK
jgi:hypothetical protein